MTHNGKSPGGSPNPQDPQQTANDHYTPEGYAVFPMKFVQSDGKWDKIPLVPWREQSRPRTEWGNKHSGAMGWGIDCGKSGLVVVDEDEADAMAAALGYVPDTYTVRTGKGRHFYFLAPAGVRFKNGVKDVPGLDVRADGGYVVAPGSKRPDGREYVVERDVPVAAMTPALIALLPKKAEPTTAQTGEPVRVRDRAAYCRAALENTMRPLEDFGVEEGGRNNALNTAAVKLGHYVGDPADGYLDEHEVRQRLEDWAAGVGLASGVAATIDSGLGDGMAEPYELVEEDSDVSEDDWGPTEQRFYREMVARDRAQRRFAREQSPDVGGTGRTMDGGEFLLDIPVVPESVWGSGKRMIWSKGEALMLVGPPGVGKTTLAGQVVRARVAGGDVLGVPVTPTDSRVLYLAMDRPEQIRRALNRNMHDLPRGVLSDRIRFWRGPLAKDLAEDPHHLLMLAREHGADTIVVDSLKDAVRGVQEDRPAAAYNTARQHCLAEGVEVLELHHLVKRGVDGKPPTDIQGVYGSAWLTAGAGSVVLLWGQPGDPIVEWTHLKQPMEEIGPFKVVHDHGAGQSEVHKPIDPVAMAEDAGAEGVTARLVAQAWFGVTKPSDAQLEKARRLLTKLADQDRLVRIEGNPVTWRAADGFDVL